MCDALVAQLVEHLTLNQRVQGSSPCRRTKGTSKRLIIKAFSEVLLFFVNRLSTELYTSIPSFLKDATVNLLTKVIKLFSKG